MATSLNLRTCCWGGSCICRIACLGPHPAGSPRARRARWLPPVCRSSARRFRCEPARASRSTSRPGGRAGFLAAFAVLLHSSVQPCPSLAHDFAVADCLSTLLQAGPLPPQALGVARLPFRIGGLDLRSAAAERHVPSLLRAVLPPLSLLGRMVAARTDATTEGACMRLMRFAVAHALLPESNKPWKA